MSYDFHLFTPSTAGDPQSSTEGDDECVDINPGPVDPAAEGRKRTIAEALIRSNAELEIFQFAFDKIAEFEGITVEDAKIRYRHFELNGAEDGNGIQITLFDDSASITVPYWHTGLEARKVFQEIWAYLQILESTGNFTSYDPQLDRTLNLADDFDDVVGRYTGVVGRINDELSS